MKFATVFYGGETVAGVIDPAKRLFWPLSRIRPDLPRSAGSDLAAAIPYLMDGGLACEPSQAIAVDKIRLCSPLTQTPHNILCVGKNYRAHALEFARSGFDASSASSDTIPEFPIIFSKPSSSIIGPDSEIPLLAGLDQAVDYEVELAVVIGRRGRAIAKQDAMSHVFGYTIVNDVTARDLQQRHKQWLLGKGIDGFCPMGPWIVVRDEIDYRDMRVICRVNGETRQDASTRDLIFDIPDLIETISLSMTLEPGDVIATGTPEGVGIGFNPPRFLKAGDLVECEITGIGRLSNVVANVAGRA